MRSMEHETSRTMIIMSEGVQEGKESAEGDSKQATETLSCVYAITNFSRNDSFTDS